ncbi:MAG: hypothetical protein AAF539_01770 [Planctomycetota bacterium]
MDRRRAERRTGDASSVDQATMDQPRRKKQRRRHIDPTTCERDYNDQEVEFMRAMDDYKRDSGRMFPTCSEVLEVVRSLGYIQLNQDQKEMLGLVETAYCDVDEFEDEADLVDDDSEMVEI